MLRAAFKTANDENTKLQARIGIASEELRQSHGRIKVLQKKSESMSLELNEAVKANHRLQLLCGHLKSESERAMKSADISEENYNSVQQDRDEKAKEIQRLRLELDEERLLRLNLETRLERERNMLLGEQRLLEQRFATEHGKRMAEMAEKVEDLSKELKKEMKEHQRTSKGLEHLRMHFASLPMTGENSGTRSGKNDELKKWTLF